MKQFTKIFSFFFSHSIDIVFPRRCPVCFDLVQPRGELICAGCVKKLSVVRQPVCKKCGKQLFSDQAEYCADCMRHKRSFEYNLAVFDYNDAASRSMSAVKYKNRREYLDFYGEAAWEKFGRQLKRIAPDGIVPVPIHPSRRKIRGFNQAHLLAETLGRKLDIPVYGQGLYRTRKTMPQKNLGAGERFKNLEQAFAPGKMPSNLERVLLVDDIYTTGSTLEACTRVLKSMGVKKVYTLTLFIGNGI